MLQSPGSRGNSDEEFHDTTADLDETTDENGIDRERFSNLVDFMGTLVPGEMPDCSSGLDTVREDSPALA